MVDVPPGFETFHNLIGKLTDKHDLARVFDDWLEYIIHAHTIGKAPGWDKPYSKNEIEIFWSMYVEMISVLNDKLVTDKSWFDFPGTYYEPCISTPYQREKAGQFFTPPDICNLLTALCLPKPGDGRIRINDPTAGSGRCLLSAHVQHPMAFMVAEDLDHTCCLMTVVNFLVHGVDGLVIWHNTLSGDFYGAWMVNEKRGPDYPIPHCRGVSEEDIEYIERMQAILCGEESLADFTIMKPTAQTTLEGLFG